MLLSEYVPLVLTSAAIAVTSIGVIEGCGTNSIADFVTVTELVPVPTTPLLSRYVTMTGMVIVAVTFAKFGRSAILSITTSDTTTPLPVACAEMNVSGNAGDSGV